jgi:hypothetical protein
MTTFHSLARRPKNSPAKSNKPFFGKVTRVIYDKTNPNEVGSVYYRNLTDPDSRERNQAYPLYAFLKNVPLVDEVVLLITAPSSETDKGIHKSRIYYISTVSIWNHPHHGATTEDKDTVGLDGDFTERADVNPMLPFPGDTILEGRLGQSIRFSQSIPGKTPWDGELGAPITILSNGQVTTASGFECITEDINEDLSSIYLTSTQTIPLKESNVNRKSYSQKPTETKVYKGNQAIISSGRIYLNASTDHILLSSPLSIGLSGDTINIDSKNLTIIEASKIELGKGATEPLLLGNKTTALIEDLLNQLLSLSIDLQAAISLPTGGPIVQLQKAGVDMGSKVITLKKNLSSLKSNKIFTK